MTQFYNAVQLMCVPSASSMRWVQGLLPAVCGSGAVYKRAVVGLCVMLTLVRFAPSSPPCRAGIRMLLSGAGI